MEIIGKISKGSKMDQVYLPKNRIGFAIGNYVVVKPLEKKKSFGKLYFYGVKNLEPIKLETVHEILNIIDRTFNTYKNILITGSFLDEGFQFNDIDIIIIIDYKLSQNVIRNVIKRKTGINSHILVLSNKDLIRGLETDPIYQIMLSKCISKKRFVYKAKHKIEYKLLDLHFLKSKTLIDNFDVLNGNEKYNLVRNMMAIHLYLNNMKVSKELVDKEIKKDFGLRDIKELKQNLIDKKDFLKKYKLIYYQTFSKILKGIESGIKQKQVD